MIFSIPAMRSLFLGAAIKAGSIFDNQKTSGTAHLMEHMLVQGTPSLPNSELFASFMEKLAGSYQAVTYPQIIRFNLSLPVLYLEDALNITAEVLFQPLFDDLALIKEKNVVVQEIKERQDALWYKNSRFFTKVRFNKGHPLQLDPGGKEQVVKNLKRGDIDKYWSSFFFPSNTYLVLVGGFDSSVIKDKLTKVFGKYQIGKNFPGYPNLTNQNMSKKTIAIRSNTHLKTCYFDLSFPSICDDDPLQDRITQSVIIAILGRLRGSRLYKLLRQQLGLVYDVGMNVASYHDFGYVDIYSQVAPDKIDQVATLIVDEIKSFIITGPIEAEINFAKNYLVNRTLMQWDHPVSIAEWILSDLLWEDKIYTPEEYVKLIKLVDKKKIGNFIDKYWDFSKLNLIVQGPIKNSENNIKKFENLVADLR